MIPVSVIITTYNEEENISRCLEALKDFDEIIVIDSNSSDRTKDIALEYRAKVKNFTWNGAYPKKRQWCLDNVEIKHDYIFFVDADEIVTSNLIEEIKNLDFNAAGYFVKGQYVWNERVLNYGLMNNKLCLFDKTKIEFLVVDDLDIEGMGEMEGHYQPVLKSQHQHETIEALKTPLLHYAYDGWEARHQRYAAWEAQMMKRNAYPKDPVKWREASKRLFRSMPIRGFIAFCHSFIIKCGFLDGLNGYDFAKSRAHYYNLVRKDLSRQ